MAHGKMGTLIFANESQYRGGFDNNKYHGKGDILYAYKKDEDDESLKKIGDVESYEGQFIKG